MDIISTQLIIATYLWWQNGRTILPLLGTNSSPIQCVLKESFWSNFRILVRRMALLTPSIFPVSSPYWWLSCVRNQNILNVCKCGLFVQWQPISYLQEEIKPDTLFCWWWWTYSVQLQIYGNCKELMCEPTSLLRKWNIKFVSKLRIALIHYYQSKNASLLIQNFLYP